MRSIKLSILTLFVALCGFAVPAIAAPGPATKAVEAANNTISGLLQKKAAPAKVTAAVRGFLDIDELGKQALSNHWSKMTAQQQTDFQTLLRGLIEDSYTKGLKANLQYKVSYLGESPGPAKNTVIVKTEIQAKKKGRPIKIEVDYTLLDLGGGKYKAFDVATDGVGLVANYRAQFDKIIAKDGVDGLIAKMKKKKGTP